MYSEEVRDLLEEGDVEKGDLVKINGKEGRLMAKPGTGDPEIINLKLNSGYNIGLKPEKIELIEKREKTDETEVDLKHEVEKPDILVLHTGGTISSRVSYEEGGVKPAFDPEDLVQMYPELAEEVNLYSKVIAQMLSEDMEPGHWQKIAEKIDEVKNDYDGIILGHGTDTMSWTGAALSLMLKGIDTGVLIVGAQRSSDRPSTDATMNLYSAIKFLTETEFEGLGICMHESINDDTCSILPPQKIRKMHTSRRDAFKPINARKIGKVNYQTGEVEESFEKEEREHEKRMELNQNVGVLKIRPGIKLEELEFLIEQDYSGVIIEGTGLGHMPVNAFDEKTLHHEKILEKLSELCEDTLVVMASQCLNGRVDLNVYDAGIKIQDAGVVEAEDMHPELAYVKLMWALGQKDSLEDAKELFQENVNGEISDRSMYGDRK